MKISIIVPVYNTQDYLEKCVNSILNQTYDNFELFLINDGSTDSSIEICKKFANNDKRVKLIDKKNEGVSKTRNLGIEQSTGDYITFIDSDDYVSSRFLEVLIYGFSKGVDLSSCGYKLTGMNLGFNDRYFLNKHNGKIISSQELLKGIIDTSKNKFQWFSVRNLYRKDIIDKYNIRFKEHLQLGEDCLFLINYVQNINSAFISSEELYMYYINSSSATRNYNPNQHRNNRYINDYIFNNIVKGSNEYYDGYCCCESSTYVGYLNNMTRKLSIIQMLKLLSDIYNTKKKYNYNIYLKQALKSRFKYLVKNQKISFLLLYLNLEIIYIFIYKIYDK